MSETITTQPPPPPIATPSETSTKLVSQDGLVGLFDILGYQVFLDNNTPETAAEKVLSTLVKLEEEMPQNLLRQLGVEATHRGAELIREIKWLVFSDTVLLTLDLKEITNPKRKALSSALFLTQCSSLWKSMFQFGLPLRGAITKGPYLIHKTCFAGRPIVEAYKLASDLNCAGVVIAATVTEFLRTQAPLMPQLDDLYYDYSFPSKTKGFVEHSVLNVAILRHGYEEKWAGDIRQLVHESFWAHNKSVGAGVPELIENTERLLRFLKMKWPAGFSVPVNRKT